jgi:hypothetical protein
LLLVDSIGNRETAQIFGTEEIISTRYYRLRVTNPTRYSLAQEVQVFLTQIDDRGPDGQPRTIFTGSVPLAWQHQPLYPNARAIGGSTVADVDLLFVSPHFLRLTPMLEPSPINLGETKIGEQHFWITAVARGVNAESRPLRLKIDWDGRWEPGDTEMGHHFTITVA